MFKEIALGLVLAATAGTVQAAETGHCGSGETSWFNAAVEGTGKMVSICGSASLDAAGAWLDYRFGKPGNVELQFPGDHANSLSAFTIRRYTRPGTTYLKLDFTNGGYTYAILEGFEAGSDPESTATLRVRRNSDGMDVASFDLRLLTDPLNMMRFEDKVPTEPFDE